MKNKNFFFGGLCLIMALGLIFAGCDDGGQLIDFGSYDKPGDVTVTRVTGSTYYIVRWTGVSDTSDYNIVFKPDGMETSYVFSNGYWVDGHSGGGYWQNNGGDPPSNVNDFEWVDYYWVDGYWQLEDNPLNPTNQLAIPTTVTTFTALQALYNSGIPPNDNAENWTAVIDVSESIIGLKPGTKGKIGVITSVGLRNDKAHSDPEYASTEAAVL